MWVRDEVVVEKSVGGVREGKGGDAKKELLNRFCPNLRTDV